MRAAAMSDVRPWVGAMVSVATFEIVRPLRIVDCSVLHDKYLSLAFLDREILEPVPSEKIDEVVWAAIDMVPLQNPSQERMTPPITPPHRLLLAA
jgi:hypothetical protein